MFQFQCKTYFFLHCLKARYKSVLVVSNFSKVHTQFFGYFSKWQVGLGFLFVFNFYLKVQQ